MLLESDRLLRNTALQAPQPWPPHAQSAVHPTPNTAHDVTPPNFVHQNTDKSTGPATASSTRNTQPTNPALVPRRPTIELSSLLQTRTAKADLAGMQERGFGYRWYI